MQSLHSSFTIRLIISKGLGFLIGLIGFLALPVLWSDADPMLRWGILFWYTTLGGIVGLMGVLDKHPTFPSILLPAWFRGIFIGGWMNFVIVFFAHDKMSAVLENMNIMGMTSPWWFVLEGAIIGLVIDLVATKFGGEGKKIL